MKTQLTNTAYTTIANEILSNLPEEDKNYEVEIEIGQLTYYVDVEYSVNYIDTIGGSYENREFEIIKKLTTEDIYISDIVVYNNDTFQEYFSTKEERNKLSTLLN